MEACVLDVAGGTGGAARSPRGAAKAASLLLHAAVCHILWCKGQLAVCVLSAPWLLTYRPFPMLAMQVRSMLGDDAVPTVSYDTDVVEEAQRARLSPAVPRKAVPPYHLLERLVAVERHIHAAALRASAVHRDVHLAVVLGASLLFPRQIVLLTLQDLYADGGGDDGAVSKKTAMKMQRTLVRFLVEHSEALALDEPLRMCDRETQTDS